MQIRVGDNSQGPTDRASCIALKKKKEEGVKVEEMGRRKESSRAIVRFVLFLRFKFSWEPFVLRRVSYCTRQTPA